MIKIAICDDEISYLDQAKEMLGIYMNDREAPYSVEAYSSSSDLIDITETGTIFDVYLLDIYMPGVTGMSVATELRSRGVKSPVIFLTSSTDHALEAFGVNATHYLLKPYSKDGFYTAMDSAIDSITSHINDSIVLKVDNEYRSILVSRIIYCESEDKYQRIYLENDERLLIRISGNELYSQIAHHESFYHCGRSHIINLDHLSRVSPDGVAIFKNGKSLKLPHSVISGLRGAFFDYYN